MNQNYIFKHWLSTLVLAPFLPSVYELIFNPVSSQIVGLVEIYPVTLVFSFFFSLPTLLIYYFVFIFLQKKKTSLLLAKFILIALTIIGIIVTLLLFGGSLVPTLLFAYSLACILSGCLIKIKQEAKYEGL